MGKKKIVTTTTTVTEEIVETNEKTLIACLLDTSGSMSGAIDGAIVKFNEFLNKQQLLPDRADMTVVIFDDQYDILYDNVDVKKVKPITKQQWHPRGMTRLNDAIGKTVNNIKNEQEKLSKKDRADKFLVVITTDGLENDSKEYTTDAIKSLIKDCEKNEWTFLYLAANQDAFAVGSTYGISKGNTFNFANNDVGNGIMYATLDNATTRYRSMSVSSASFLQDKESLIAEEEDKDSGLLQNQTVKNNFSNGTLINGTYTSSNTAFIAENEEDKK
jgi:uncharacterized protein YegL